jgi:hypothetical protein
MALMPNDMLRIDGEMYPAPSWPPPETVKVGDRTYVLVSYSQITDEQITSMDRVFRGAEYAPA